MSPRAKEEREEEDDTSTAATGTAAASAAGEETRSCRRRSKGGCYGFLFPFVRAAVNRCFFSVKLGRVRLPVASFLVLAVNVALVGCIAGAVWKTSFKPKINISIRSFGIPNHPAQENWDAYISARSDRYVYSAEDSQDGDLPLPLPDEERTRRKLRSYPPVDEPVGGGTWDGGWAAEPASPCYHTPSVALQSAPHRDWALDIIYRVPAEAAERDDNVLRWDRVSRIHYIEEYLYNSLAYHRVCRLKHSSNSDPFCYPLNSLLSWFYRRDNTTGKYVYDTPDHFTPNVTATVEEVVNREITLFFTGSEVSYSPDYSYVEGKVLRSQIRVGMPLFCFNQPYDRNSFQKELITETFLSLEPVFEELSNG